MPRVFAPARLRVTGLGLIAPGALHPRDALRPHAEPAPGWFETAALLPGRGYRRLPPGCLYLLAAARAALADTGTWFDALEPAERAAVVGTNNAGAALQDEFDRAVIEFGASALSPARIPYMATSMFAGRLAPEHGLRAFDLATSSPATAGLEALQTAARALAAGRAAAVLAGAVEDLPAPAQQGLPSPAPHTRAGEDIGAALLVCESAASPPRGGTVYGHCAVHSVFLPPREPSAARRTSADALEHLWDALTRGGPPLARIDAVLDDSAAGAFVADWLTARAGDTAVTIVPRRRDAGCLTPVRRVVGRLAERAAQRTAVLTASAYGHVSAAELTPPENGHSGPDSPESRPTKATARHDERTPT